MSELQAALLAIGSGVIVVVYVFGWWQQRKYRRKFGAAFKASHADALYQGSIARPAGQALEPMADEATGEATPAAGEAAAEMPAATLLDGTCALLDVRSDFIIELHLF